MDILIVDDEKSIRLTTSLALEGEGHYVETAQDGSLALKRIKEENFDPEIAKKARKKITALSSREMELLQLIAEGRSNKQVASDLDISIKTVEKHRQNLMLKLNLHDTAGITRYAISKGIIESGVQLIEF